MNIAPALSPNVIESFPELAVRYEVPPNIIVPETKFNESPVAKSNRLAAPRDRATSVPKVRLVPSYVRLALSISLPPVVRYGTRPLVRDAIAKLVVVALVIVALVPIKSAKLVVLVNVGPLENTAKPPPAEPVSSDKSAASCDEFVKDDESPSDDVATCNHVFPAPPIKSWFWVMVDKPVPPRIAARIPVVSESAIPRVEVATAETVLSALILRNDRALGLVKVKMLSPMVVAPRLVRAPAAVLAPVPPLVRARALMRFRVVMVDEEMVVVAKVEMPEIDRVPVAVRLPPTNVFPPTVSLLPGVVEPIPTFPLFNTDNTFVLLLKRLRILPVPF